MHPCDYHTAFNKYRVGVKAVALVLYIKAKDWLELFTLQLLCILDFLMTVFRVFDHSIRVCQSLADFLNS